MLQDLVSKYRAMKPAYYVRQYERLFWPIASSVRKVLEIGIQGGGSLRVWRDLFPNAGIVGLDVLDFAIDEPRITALVGNQACKDDVQRAAALGPYDIIIDDGSHVPAHWVMSCAWLTDALLPGGMYVIEDTQAARQTHLGMSAKDAEDIEICLRWVIDPVMRSTGPFDWVEVHNHLVIAHKATGSPEASNWWEEERRDCK